MDMQNKTNFPRVGLLRVAFLASSPHVHSGAGIFLGSKIWETEETS